MVILCSHSAYNQDKGDLSIGVSSDQSMRLALEYRRSQKGQYTWRIGFVTGQVYGSGWAYSPQNIISSSDSLIVYD